ncbi:hypothetical protein H6F61_05370 [Cyanobacteria bacterium FACHB-472]|nr:hypothetical protein [Cyanobacteria bacterium FACHB-472]
MGIFVTFLISLRIPEMLFRGFFVYEADLNVQTFSPHIRFIGKLNAIAQP